MTLKTQHIVSTIAAILGLGALGAAAFAGTTPPAALPPGTTPIDPDSQVVLSNFVIKNGQCYYAVVYASGRGSSTPVAMSFCTDASVPAPTGPSSGGFTPTVTPPPELGRYYIRR